MTKLNLEENALILEIKRLQAENEALSVKQAKLVALVQKAYHEGFGEGIKEHTTHRGGKGWYESRARAQLDGLSKINTALDELARLGQEFDAS
jgi:hypothetical protein